MTNKELKNYLEDENWELFASDFTETIENYIKTIEKDTDESLTEEQKEMIHDIYYQRMAEVIGS